MIRVRETDRGGTCMYCKDSTDVAGTDDELVVCEGCRTLIHLGCRRDLERCPTPGCVMFGREPGPPLASPEALVATARVLAPSQGRVDYLCACGHVASAHGQEGRVAPGPCGVQVARERTFLPLEVVRCPCPVFHTDGDLEYFARRLASRRIELALWVGAVAFVAAVVAARFFL